MIGFDHIFLLVECREITEQTEITAGAQASSVLVFLGRRIFKTSTLEACGPAVISVCSVISLHFTTTNISALANPSDWAFNLICPDLPFIERMMTRHNPL